MEISKVKISNEAITFKADGVNCLAHLDDYEQVAYLLGLTTCSEYEEMNSMGFDTLYYTTIWATEPIPVESLNEDEKQSLCRYFIKTIGIDEMMEEFHLMKKVEAVKGLGKLFKTIKNIRNESF